MALHKGAETFRSTWMRRSNASSALTMVLTLAMIRHFSKPHTSEASCRRGGQGRSATKSRVDMAFLRRISRLLRVLVPGPLSLEAGCLVTVAGLLMARTSLDVVMLNLTTTIERAIVARDKGAFRGGMSRFARMCVPVAVVNSLLKYLQGELSLRFRQRLTAHVISKYMEGVTFYAVSNLDGRIANPDQAITQDIERFAESLADLYSNITKPVLDILVYVRSLSDKVDAVAPATMIGYLLLSGVALGALRKPTAAYTSLVAQQEGEYRYVNSRLLTNAQEIAFCKGNKKESQVLRRVFDKLVCVTRRSERFRHSLGVLDSVVAKYFATIVGWTVVSRPFVNLDHPRHTQSTTAEVYQDYHSSGRMMLNLSSALGRLVLAGRELARLSGFSSRVTGLIDVIDDVNRGFYKRGRLPKGTENDLVGPPSAAAVTTPIPAAAEARARATPPIRNAGVAGVNLATDHTPPWSKAKMETVQSEAPSSAGTISVEVQDDDTPTAREAAEENEGSGLVSLNGAREDVARFPRNFETEAFSSAVTGQPELAPEAGIATAGAEGGDEAQVAESPAVMGGGALKRSGSVLLNEDSVIEFIDVPLVTPTGEVLIESLSFKVEAGMNVLIAGPNGSGKSSMFRVLGGLWPLAGGTLLKPPGSRLFYVPQRPYLALGTLRDQVVYPHTLEEAIGKGLTDEALVSILESVKLGYLLEREGGWDAVRDWSDVLSGGEKQRLALSRLFYHRPQFAILDECTSAVSVDVEGAIYRLAARSGITLFTVSHRKSLWEHHEYLLRFDGLGGYEFKPMSEVVNGERFGS
ncbi:unnamed protein product [Ascophyllum nodosum]